MLYICNSVTRVLLFELSKPFRAEQNHTDRIEKCKHEHCRKYVHDNAVQRPTEWITLQESITKQKCFLPIVLQTCQEERQETRKNTNNFPHTVIGSSDHIEVLFS